MTFCAGEAGGAVSGTALGSGVGASSPLTFNKSLMDWMRGLILGTRQHLLCKPHIRKRGGIGLVQLHNA